MTHRFGVTTNIPAYGEQWNSYGKIPIMQSVFSVAARRTKALGTA
jgi:hypothetical protein